MPKYIVSQPAITLCIESRSSRLPTTTSAPMSRNACARLSSFRTIARTALPCFKSSSVTVRPTAPTRPAAPVTRMGFAIFLLLHVQRYGLLGELLTAVDVEGGTGNRCVGHDVYSERGHVRWSDDAPDGKLGTKLIAAVFEFIT